ncbi:MAG: 3'(2'),5'-bisphosphate nucleotidase CysQ [Thermoleophilia bacterium]|nr:3'(2'),5'-bisphosphate nucleotidase CysQ [Thermoleophilia bacterium]
MLEDTQTIVRRAGDAIMEVYRSAREAGGVRAESKADGSPLTVADRRAHDIIVQALAERWPDIPVLSEEGKEIPHTVRASWRRLWLVDPLDGTKEFVRGLDEFTVNIALIEDGRPVLGVVCVPAKDLVYAGSRASGATVRAGDGPPRAIHVRPAEPGEGLVVMTSRSHPSEKLGAYLRALNVVELVPAGSSLKLCAVAEGRAHLYPRLGPTMEWDIAAGQAVVEAAGGEVVDLDGRSLTYNKQSLVNPDFVARARRGAAH